MTDNRNRTVSDVRHAFSKYGGNLGTDGSVSYLFKKLGIVQVDKNFTEEELMEIVIDMVLMIFLKKAFFLKLLQIRIVLMMLLMQ
ncbi:MAG: hypothetical protein Ct9H90mP22_8920 [Gammaproteobacteria bacterium]|nr:MAG: hypothetical protein Ct9H90mP22_8920 [Gammaproteobacteria bacterium]